jgi:hypothetical protein
MAPLSAAMTAQRGGATGIRGDLELKELTYSLAISSPDGLAGAASPFHVIAAAVRR